MSKKFDYDLIVLGSGPAGSSAALFAAKAGIKVALVESNKWGGSALNFSDVPARTLFNFSHLYHEAHRGSRFGLSSSSLRYNYPTVQNWKLLATRRAGAGSKKQFEAAKIACLSGFASFLSPYEIALKNQIISAPKFILAIGSKPSFGDISGVESATCFTPAEALSLNRPPKSVFVVGAGSTGVELANYFAELGSQVVLGELSGRLLPREDEEVGQLLAGYFENSLHIKVLTQSRVVAVGKGTKPGLQKVIFRRGGQEKSVEVSAIVLATGSKPVTNLSLENAGVKYADNGIVVDDFLKTSMKHIYAAGDCLGGESSLERAAYEGALAASNAVGKKTKNLRNYEGFIRLTSTSPSVATTGLTEDDCVKKHITCKKAVLPLSAVSASNVSDFRYGFVKILADPKDKLLGATVVCPEAELVIQEVATAVRHKFTITQLASTPHISFSWSELVHLAAKKLAK